MPVPQIPVIERTELLRSRIHVLKPSDPDESIGPVQVTELSNHRHPGLIERIGERRIEQLDESVPMSGMKRVLAQLHDVAAFRTARLVPAWLRRAARGDAQDRAQR